jgi:CheY-like chemotaxis protein
MRRKLKFLVVDDSSDWLELIHYSLSKTSLGIEPIGFCDPQRALAYLRRHHVDMVISDLHMPGLDGFGLIEEFRNFDKTTPVILVSTAECTPAEALGRGANAFVPKDALGTGLARAITEILSPGKLAGRAARSIAAR